MKIIRHLQRNDPCLVCSGPNPGNCRETGVSYRIECHDECSYEYTGQTAYLDFDICKFYRMLLLLRQIFCI